MHSFARINQEIVDDLSDLNIVHFHRPQIIRQGKFTYYLRTAQRQINRIHQ